MYSEQKLLHAAHKIFEHLASLINARFSVRLWDGTMIPLGSEVDTGFFLSISGPGVLGSLIRRPTRENLLILYTRGQIDFHGGNLVEFITVARKKGFIKKKGKLKKSLLVRHGWPFLFTPADKDPVQHGYKNDSVGRRESRRNNKEFIQFHYDISNDFYALFLDPEMQYSCGYFIKPDNSLEQAQLDKLEMICRKLRLKPGEKLLDIGCGWGGLICYAAQNYGARAFGVTLSQTQYDFTREKIKRLRLEDQVTVELCDYSTIKGTFDKIVSVGMFEHIGISNMPKYFKKIHSLLPDRGILLNHGISRRAKASKRAARKIRPERRLLLKYIFPGSELDNIGHTIDLLEICGYEVHDVEAWREHYALTCKAWHERLYANREKAISLVGPERFRLWLLYLAGVATGFADGSMHIYQVVATKHSTKGLSGLPPTRGDLYRS